MGRARRKSESQKNEAPVKFNTGSRAASRKQQADAQRNSVKMGNKKGPSTLPRQGKGTVGMPGNAIKTPTSMTAAATSGIQRNTRRTSMYARSNRNDVIQGVEDISKAPWYIGKTSRVECDMAVMAANSGDWLVRMSSNQQTYVICVNDNGVCQNFQVHIKGKKFNMGGIDFNSVMECLMYLKNNPINGKSGRLYYLGNPASEMKWYVGAMNKEECDKMVLAAGKSDYLVRMASDKVNYCLCINQGNGKAKNCKIFHVGGAFTLGKTTEKTMEELLDTLQSVPIPTNSGDSNLYLRKPAAKADYYAGQMPRAECEGYVKKAGNGDFLIRQNSRGDKYVLVVNDSKNILNFIISQTPDGKFEFGGLPHDSLEMVIRYLKKAPLASKSGGQLFINRPARMTNAEDMIADVAFGFDGADEDDEEESPRAAPRRRQLTRGGGGGMKNPPAFASDSEEEEEDEEDDEVYDDATEERFNPYRVVSIREITGICPAGAGIFVISKNDSTNTFIGIYKGEQITVPQDAVEKEEERKALPQAPPVEEEEEEEEDDDDDFGNFEEDEEEVEKRKAEAAAERQRIQEESAKRLADMQANISAQDDETKAEAERLAREAEEMAAKIAALEAESDEEGFGSDVDDSDDEEEE